MVGTTSTSKMEEFSSCGFTQGQLKINPLLWAKLHVLFVWALSGIDSPRVLYGPLAVCKEGEKGWHATGLKALFS